MEWVETTGRTVDEAKGRALDRLGVHEDDAEFEIVDEPRPGLFGRMRGEARVRARVRPTRPRPKVERRDRKKRPAPASPESPSNEQEAAAVTTAPPPSEPSDPAREAAVAEEFLAGLASAFGLAATTEVIPDDDETEVRLLGADLGLLIGPRGQTLVAVQELTRLAVTHAEGERKGRLRIDIGGYRAKRSEALARFAVQVAGQVASSGVARALEPMSSADRKVVHDTIAAVPGVSTTSEGEDPHRHVVIRPDA
jgi:spoIIIJ-associated protein